MSTPIRRRVAAAVLGLSVGLAGIGSTALASRGNGNPNPGPCHHGQHVGNPHCDDHDGGDDGDHGGHDGDHGGHDGGDNDHGSLISINVGDIDLDVLEVAINKVLTVVDVDALNVEDVSVLAHDVINVLANANVEDVTGVDLDAAIITVIDDVASGDILSNNTVAVNTLVHGVANDVINVSQVGVAAVAAVSDTDVLSNDNINVLGCQSNVETGNGNLNGPGDDSAGSNNCGLLGGVGPLGGDLLGDDLLDGGLLAVLHGDASVTAGVLGLF